MKTPSSSRIIGAESLTGVRRFTLSDLADDPLDSPATPNAESEAVRDPAYEAGHAQGLREGLRQGLEAGREQAAREAARRDEQAAQGLAARAALLCAALDEEFAAIRRSVADELVALAIAIARRTVGEALEADPALVAGIAREAVAALLDERSSFSLHLNPNDKMLVDHALSELLAARGARTVADPSIAPGGCRVIAPGAEVDATLESRWRRVIGSMGRQAPELTDTGAH